MDETALVEKVPAKKKKETSCTENDDILNLFLYRPLQNFIDFAHSHDLRIQDYISNYCRLFCVLTINKFVPMTYGVIRCCRQNTLKT